MQLTGLGRIEYLGFVSAAFDVGFPRTMAALAVDACRPVLRGHPRMWIAGEALGDVLVAGGANFSTYVISGRAGLCLIGGRFVFCPRRR